MPKLIYAYLKEKIGNVEEKKLVHVDSVKKGKRCNCICPWCGEDLIARNGGKKQAHCFAHKSNSDCVHGYQTSLHLLAKEIIAEEKYFFIPDVYVNFDYKSKEFLESGKEIVVDTVELEKRDDKIIPDIIIHSGEAKFYVEIFVTHKVYEEKLEKIKEQNVSTIEVDLSQLDHSVSKEELREILIGDSKEKKWVYNKSEYETLAKFKQNAELMETIVRGCAVHIDYCPCGARVWNGKPYANLYDDCMGCKYCVEVGFGGILCSGKKKIATCEDLKRYIGIDYENYHVANK